VQAEVALMGPMKWTTCKVMLGFSFESLQA
jgi:hypothetical protein